MGTISIYLTLEFSWKFSLLNSCLGNGLNDMRFMHNLHVWRETEGWKKSILHETPTSHYLFT